MLQIFECLQTYISVDLIQNTEEQLVAQRRKKSTDQSGGKTGHIKLGRELGYEYDTILTYTFF